VLKTKANGNKVYAHLIGSGLNWIPIAPILDFSNYIIFLLNKIYKKIKRKIIIVCFDLRTA
jgi:hypothetical protein